MFRTDSSDKLSLVFMCLSALSSRVFTFLPLPLLHWSPHSLNTSWRHVSINEFGPILNRIHVMWHLICSIWTQHFDSAVQQDLEFGRIQEQDAHRHQNARALWRRRLWPESKLTSGSQMLARGCRHRWTSVLSSMLWCVILFQRSRPVPDRNQVGRRSSLN